MVLYKKKNNDLAPIDNALDRLLLLFAFNYPFVAFIANDPTAMARVPAILRSGVNAVALLLLIGTIVLAIGLASTPSPAPGAASAAQRSEVFVTGGGDTDALDCFADSDAGETDCARGDSHHLSQPAISPADLVS